MSINVESISSIKSIDLSTIHKVMSSSAISESQKEAFVRKNRSQIHEVLREHLTGSEFKFIMKNRPLRKFRFLKNSITKRGDKALLAMTLGISPAELNDYIEEVEEGLVDADKLSYLSKDKIDAIKTYVYRHGSTDNIEAFLDYELKNSKDMLATLYRTLEYHSGGIADYFIRPVHRMTNKTLVKLYNIIDKNITSARDSGSITEEEYDKTARWALVQIYKIQNNSKLINAIKTYKTLND